MLARVAFALMNRFANVGPVVQEAVEEPLGDGLALTGRDPALGELPQDGRTGTDL